MKFSGWLVTGTDTEVGKTRISLALMQALQQRGLRVAGFKPMASGAESTAEGLRNADALALQQQSSVPQAYAVHNPWCFAPAIAPHIAAAQANTVITLPQIHSALSSLQSSHDRVVVEGAGGWLVPINADLTLAGLAQTLRLPVIVVVGIKLGCLNHALLTAQAIVHSGLELAGWVANDLHGDPLAAEMHQTLLERMPAPCLGFVPPLTRQQSAREFLQLPAGH